MSPPPHTLDLFTAAERLAEHLAHPPATVEGRARWFEAVEIHLLAVRVLLDAHADACGEDPTLLWDAPRVAPMLRRLHTDCDRLAALVAFALAAVRAPDRSVAEVRHAAGALTRRIGVHRSRLDGIYHEAFAVDIGGPG